MKGVKCVSVKKKKKVCGSFESYKVLKFNLYIYEGGDGDPNK
jgi:hypothetical protein